MRPGSVDEALRVLDEHAGAARVLAGGQSLVPMLHMRLMQVSALVDINRLDELGDVRAEGATTVLGPLVRYAEIERSPIVSERLPLLQCIVGYVGDPQVRNRGTLGGSLAQADPTGEMPLACLALDATVVAASVSGRREIPIDDFLESAYATTLEPEEMITEVRFPAAPDAFAFLERGRRHNDFAVLSVAVLGRSGADGRWPDLRIALGGVNDRAVLATRAARPARGHRARGRGDRRGRAGRARGGRSAQRRARLRRVPAPPGAHLRAARAGEAARRQGGRACLIPCTISVTVNGRAYRREVEPRVHLADFLRHDLGLTGTHIGCEQGVCGNCTVLVDGEAVKSCLMFAAQADGDERARPSSRSPTATACTRCSRRSRRRTRCSAATARRAS